MELFTKFINFIMRIIDLLENYINKSDNGDNA